MRGRAAHALLGSGARDAQLLELDLQQRLDVRVRVGVRVEG